VQSVTLAWSASADPTVVGYNLYYGGASQTYTNLVAAGGLTTATVSGLLPGATYFFAATAVDSVGLASVFSNEISYQVPASGNPPTVALTAPLNGASYPAPAAITLAASVTANGHSITQVQFYNGATLLGASAAAPYSLSWSGVGAGSYGLTAQAVYDTGSTVASSTVNVTVTNNLAPTVALTAPLNGASYPAPATITLAASVTANGHSITQVQFYNGATLLGASAAAPYSLSWSSVGAGGYSLTAQAVYDTGSTVASSTVNVTVTNNLAPTVALTAPLNGASYPAPATITLAASVTANGHSITQVQFYNGATLLGASASAPYSLSWSSVSAGSYSLTAQAVYDTGSTVASSPVNVTVTNTLAPTVALTAPLNGASYAAPATITLAASVTANGHSITQVQFYNGATLLGASASAPYSLSWSSVSAGSYSLTAQAVYDTGSTVASSTVNVTVTALAAQSVTLAWSLSADPTVVGYNLYYGGASQTYTNMVPAGNVATAAVSGLLPGATYFFAATAVDNVGLASVFSNEISYQVPASNNLPTVALTAPLNGASYTAPAAITLAASVTANGHSITQVQFYNGATLLGASASAPYSLSWSGVGAGSYSLTAKAVYDTGSTVVSSPVNVTVTSSAPTVALTAPLNGASYTAPAAITLAASVTANGHSITQVQFYNGATLLGASASAPCSLIWSNVSVGSYSLTAKAVYDAGSTVASSPVNVTVTTNPAPTVALTAPLNGANYTAPAAITLAASVTANGHSITQVQFYNGATLLGASTSAPYSVCWSNVSAGSYSLTAKAVYDASSTVVSSPVNITVVGLPAPWQTADIGSVGVAGSASMSNSIYTVKGAGAISGTADNFRFVYQPLSGNGEITACLNSVQNTGTSGRIGVMIRETLTTGSGYAFMGISPDGTFRWQQRSKTGGSTSSTASTSGTPPSVWTRLIRTGNVFCGYQSTDGATWTQVNSCTNTMATQIYVGLAVASGSSTTLNTATFAKVAVVP
jgi:sulfur relay (sulfurtransferase) complex TusBCD TusD component (DsrE family)